MAVGEIKALQFIDGITVTAGSPSPSARFTLSDSTGWTGAVSTVTYDVSATVSDATLLVWRLKDAANLNLDIGCEIDNPTATTVRVTTSDPLAAGTYLLVGV